MVYCCIMSDFLCMCLFSTRHRLASGASEKLQLSSLIAAFQVARDLVLKEASSSANWMLVTSSSFNWISISYVSTVLLTVSSGSLFNLLAMSTITCMFSFCIFNHQHQPQSNKNYILARCKLSLCCITLYVYKWHSGKFTYGL